jgi:hypothetical protein
LQGSKPSLAKKAHFHRKTPGRNMMRALFFKNEKALIFLDEPVFSLVVWSLGAFIFLPWSL